MNHRRGVGLLGSVAGLFIGTMLGLEVAQAQPQDGGLPAVAARVSTLESVVTTQQTALASLQGSLAAVQSSITLVQNSVTTLQGNVTAAQTALASLQASVAALQTAVASLQTTNNNLQTSLNGLGSRVTNLEQKGSGTPVAFGGPFRVPTGKRLRIDTVSGRALGSAGSDGSWVVTMGLARAGQGHEVNFVPLVDRTSRNEQWRFHQVTSIMVESDTDIDFSNQCNGCPQGMIVTATGVLLDAD